MDKIKYTFIPADNIDDGMMQVVFSKDIIYTDVYIINNAARGILLDQDLKGMIKVATEKNLDEVLRKVAMEDECEAIVINGFNISLDDIRNKYIDFAKQYDIYLCVNKISDKVTKNVTLNINYDILDATEEEWEERKKQINEQVDLYAELKEEDYYDNDFITKTFKSLLFPNTDSVILKDFDTLEKKISIENDKDIDIKETYTYINQGEEITIHKLNDNSVVISDGDSEVIIGENLLSFLKKSIMDI